MHSFEILIQPGLVKPDEGRATKIYTSNKRIIALINFTQVEVKYSQPHLSNCNKTALERKCHSNGIHAEVQEPKYLLIFKHFIKIIYTVLSKHKK